MVLCLVTLTYSYMRHVGLSASVEVLVHYNITLGTPSTSPLPVFSPRLLAARGESQVMPAHLFCGGGLGSGLGLV